MPSDARAAQVTKLTCHNSPWRLPCFAAPADGAGGPAWGDATMDIKIVIALLIVGTLLLLVNYFPSPM